MGSIALRGLLRCRTVAAYRLAEKRYALRIGILELLVPSRAGSWKELIGNHFMTKPQSSIMPQAVSVWCREMGHEVFYSTFYGQADPKKLLPGDLDVIFVACITRAAPLAYALAKVYKSEGTLTVIGGGHSKSFPHDCLRFFDLVVLQCDRDLIVDILTGGCRTGTMISSEKVLTELPTVEQRMPEIRTSTFSDDKPYSTSVVPVLSSVGCPYDCNFCTDWNNPYALLPADHLEADMRYLSKEVAGVKVAFHDPNFGVKFDQTLAVIDRLPDGSQSPYIIESSLSLLKEQRLKRLQRTNCFYVAPAIESWSSYSNKAGVGTQSGARKLNSIVDHLELIHEYIRGIQVNFIFGLDHDEGDEPVELTKEFMDRTPFAWPLINIPVPFGGTPLYDDFLKEDRVLRPMPFMFYYLPYLVFKLKNYDPASYYEKLVDMLEHYTTKAMLWRRLSITESWTLRGLYVGRTLRAKTSIGGFRKILKNLVDDRQFRAFHDRESEVLPDFYRKECYRLLGDYAPLMSEADLTPDLQPSVNTAVPAPRAVPVPSA